MVRVQVQVPPARLFAAKLRRFTVAVLSQKLIRERGVVARELLVVIARLLEAIVEGGEDVGAAAEGFDRRRGSVAFGAVLVEAIDHAFRASVGNLRGAAEAVGLAGDDSFDRFGDLVRTLDHFVAEHPDIVGSREWLWLFRNLVVAAIDEGADFRVSTTRLQRLLEEGARGDEIP